MCVSGHIKVRTGMVGRIFQNNLLKVLYVMIGKPRYLHKVLITFMTVYKNPRIGSLKDVNICILGTTIYSTSLATVFSYVTWIETKCQGNTSFSIEHKKPLNQFRTQQFGAPFSLVNGFFKCSKK